MRDGALNANLMSVKFDGKHGKSMKTRIREVGTYQRILSIGDKQLSDFTDGDSGPFYLTPEEQIHIKYNRFSGVTKSLE